MLGPKAVIRISTQVWLVKLSKFNTELADVSASCCTEQSLILF